LLNQIHSFLEVKMEQEDSLAGLSAARGTMNTSAAMKAQSEASVFTEFVL